jgi:hypothetical protein
MTMSDTEDQVVDEAAWDAAGDGIDVDVVRALRATGVQVEHLGRAAKFLNKTPGDTPESLKRHAEYLRDDLPALFTPQETSGAADTNDARGGESKSGVSKGRDKAIELGWIKPATTTKGT